MYELSQLALKFERHLLSEVIDFQARAKNRDMHACNARKKIPVP